MLVTFVDMKTGAPAVFAATPRRGAALAAAGARRPGQASAAVGGVQTLRQVG